jgi:DGQHR domain-containing protein
MAKLKGVSRIELVAVQTKNLDTICFRGESLLAHLALISQADVFDQVTNPDGLQRDLSPKHASEVYDYVAQEPEAGRPRAFPEVVLNVRDKKILRIEEIKSGSSDKIRAVRLLFNVDKLADGKVRVSRVDGNHRLFYAAGDERRNPLLVPAPFQLHVGLSREQERALFVDINANQKGLNTSHLAIMQHRLTPEELEMRDHLDRWITSRLTSDPESPWHGVVGGGSKKGARAQNLTRLVNFVALQTGVHKTLSKSQYIRDFTNPEVQYVIIRNYWRAVKNVFATEWANPKEYLILKNVGVLSFSLLGGTIIDRCIPRGKHTVADMTAYLRQVKTRFDWSTTANPGENTVVGMSGNKAALILAGEMAAELTEPSGENPVKDLQDQLLAQMAGSTN